MKGIKQKAKATTDEKTEAKAKTSGSRITARHDDNIKAKDNNNTSGSWVKP